MSVRRVVDRQPAQQPGEGNHTQILRQFLQTAPVRWFHVGLEAERALSFNSIGGTGGNLFFNLNHLQVFAL